MGVGMAQGMWNGFRILYGLESGVEWGERIRNG